MAGCTLPDGSDSGLNNAGLIEMGCAIGVLTGKFGLKPAATV